MRQSNSDIYTVIGIVTLNCAGTFFLHIPLVRLALALPMVFFIPGYVVTELLNCRGTLAASHRIIFSLGLSITLDIAGGFLLNLFPFGLRAASWTILLDSFSLILALIVPLLRRDTASIVSTGAALNLNSLLRGVALSCLAVTLVVVTLIYAMGGVAQQPQPGFTQLWMLPSTQSSHDCVVRLGVHSFETTPVTYHATLSINAVREIVWPSIALAPNQTWEQPILLATNTRHSATIDVKLYKGNTSTSVYRQVHVTLHFDGTKGAKSCA